MDCCENVDENDIDIVSRKNSVNVPVAFSTLKLNRAFNSTSVKSNGAPSDFYFNNQILGRGQDGKISHGCFCVIITGERVNGPFSSRADKRTIACVSSYEISAAHRVPGVCVF